jgi:hypothetical protein
MKILFEDLDARPSTNTFEGRPFAGMTTFIVVMPAKAGIQDGLRVNFFTGTVP